MINGSYQMADNGEYFESATVLYSFMSLKMKFSLPDDKILLYPQIFPFLYNVVFSATCIFKTEGLPYLYLFGN